MARFIYKYHTEATQYPDPGGRTKMGRGWVHAVTPVFPGQRTFELNFPAMKWFLTPTGQLDVQTKPELNLGHLEQFYQQHLLHVAFVYPHPRFGDLNVLFKSPPSFPPARPGGSGVVEGFRVELVEMVY
jgi:hypothetical protein